MTFKRLILVLTITVSILIMSLLGVSYAWYSIGSTEFNVSTTDVPDFSVIYAQSSYVSLKSAIPIQEEMSSKKAGISRFTITPNDKNISVVIKLINIQIDDALKNPDFKIQLYEGNNLVFDGNGTNVVENTILLTEDIVQIPVGVTKNYELRLWILETEESQNEFMGKSFSGQLQIYSSAD